MLKSRACDAMTGAGGGFSEWSNESRGGNGLGRRDSGRLSLLGEKSRNMCVAGGAEVAGSSIASQRSVEHGLFKRPERRQVLCRGPGDDACGHVEEALAPQERRQGFVPDDAAAR